jgi:DNA-binding protein YbaB
MKNLGQMMKQIQGMQSQMADMQASLERLEMSGQSGGGMVSVTLNARARCVG